MQRKWRERIGEGQLVVLPSPYRHLIEPVRDFVLGERDKIPGGFVHVIMGQLVMNSQVQRSLHSNNALGIMGDLQRFDRVVVTDVPYQLYPHCEVDGNSMPTGADVAAADVVAEAPTVLPTPQEMLPPAQAPGPQPDANTLQNKGE
jgi:hypothetical protein